MKKIDCSEQIIPSISIGNIQQGANIQHYISNIDNTPFLKLSIIEHNLRLIEYDFNSCIKIIVDVFYGTIVKIVAYNNYSGKLNNQIYIGLTIRELLIIDDTFECCAGGLMSMNFLGICVYFTDNFDADVHDLTPYLDNRILGIGLISQFSEDGTDNYIELYGEKYFDRKNNE